MQASCLSIQKVAGLLWVWTKHGTSRTCNYFCMLILWSTIWLKLFIISNEFLWTQVILHIGYVICKYNLISSLLWCFLLFCPSALRPGIYSFSWNGLIQSNKLVTPKTVMPLLHQGSQSGRFTLYHSMCTVGQNYCQVSSLRRLKSIFWNFAC